MIYAFKLITEIFFQVLITVVVGNSLLTAGFVEGWTANLPKIQEDETTGFNMTMYDVKWLGMIIIIKFVKRFINKEDATL